MKVRKLTETKQVKVKDIDFEIRFISRKIWRSIPSRLASCFSVFGSGNDNLQEKMSGANKEDVKEASIELQDVYTELVKYGVLSHSGIVDEEDKEIPASKDDDGNLGSETIDLYDLNGLLVPLASEILAFNTLSDGDKKN